MEDFFFVPGGDSDNESLQQYYLHTDTQQLFFSFFTITTLAKMHINQNRFQVKLVWDRLWLDTLIVVVLSKITSLLLVEL